MRKMIFPMLFSLAFCLFFIPVRAQAANDTITDGDYTYTISRDGEAVLSAYNGTEDSITIPDSVAYGNMIYPVRSIGVGAFAENKNIRALVIPEGITDIEADAFRRCTRLKSITINGNINDCAGADYPFYNAGADSSSLSVTFGSKVTRIPAFLFSTDPYKSNYCAHITSVDMSANVTQIGSYAFCSCRDLTSLKVSESLKTIDKAAFMWTSLTEFAIPDSVTTVAQWAFYGCSDLTSVTIPASIRSIPYYTFSDTGLKEITFKGNAPSIDRNAFGGVTATAYYPWPNTTWKAGARQDYGGKLTWVAYDSGEPPLPGDTLAVRRGQVYYFKYTIGAGEADKVIAYGQAEDDVLTGDWNGDGVDTLCVRRGNVYYFKNSIDSGNADAVIVYGKAEDEVLVGDWDGDGIDTLAVRRGNVYYIKNSIAAGDADKMVVYGIDTDITLAGDWNGDGIDTLAVRRGNVYYIKNTIDPGEADAMIAYGKTDDAVLVGDWDGDAMDTLCVRRGNVYYFKNSISPGNADTVIAYGRDSDKVYAGKWQ